jgi:hypothetical protein
MRAAPDDKTSRCAAIGTRPLTPRCPAGAYEQCAAHHPAAAIAADANTLLITSAFRSIADMAGPTDVPASVEKRA